MRLSVKELGAARVGGVTAGAASMVHRLRGVVLDAVYPRWCAACRGDVGTAPGHLCWECRADFVLITEPFCSHCGDPIDGAVDAGVVCGWCRRHRPRFDRARSALRFRGGVRHALHRFKYGRAVHLRRELADYMAACVAVHFGDVRFDDVTCVPLHGRRERERTYNQSALLGRELAARLDLPWSPRLLARTRPTRTQTHLTAQQRRDNVRNAFTVREPEWTDGRYWLLIDDVMTTGATADACSRVLKEAGAAAVYVVTVARG